VKLALAAGGTGGHMFPAQALAEEAKRRGWDVLLLTDQRGKKYTDGFPADETVLLKAASPSAKGLMAKVSAAFTLLQGIGRARGALKLFGADAVVGFGGYPSAPSMLAAQRMRLPTGLHEQNAVLGRANRLAVGRAGFLAHAFPILDKKPASHPSIHQTGNPVRQAVIDAAGASYPSVDEERLKVLIFGGSQGANLFAKIFAPAIAGLPKELRDRLDITHQVSDEARPATDATYSSAGIAAETAAFFNDLPKRIAASHLVIARSGASSVTELAVIGRPALLVPLKIAMDDHQRVNAEVLTSVGAAELILEDDLNRERAGEVLLRLLSSPDRLTQMANAAKGRMPEGAAPALADLVERLVAGHLSD